MTPLNEPILSDDYPVYFGYAYVADGEPVVSPICGNVGRLKKILAATEIRRCDLARRGLLQPEG